MTQRILIVDDDAMVGEIISLTLKRAGFECRAVTRADAALALAWQEDFQLAILDVALPQMSGLMLAENLRATHPHLPILLTTGLSADIAGADGHETPRAYPLLEKPFRPADLLANVNRLLESVSAPR